MTFSQLLLHSLLGGAIVFAVWSAGRRHQGWRAFAKRHGWAFTGSLVRLELMGRHQGRTVSVSRKKSRSSDRPPRTVVRMDVGDVLPPELFLREGELREGILVWLGIRDDDLGTNGAAQVIDQHRLTPQAITLLRTPSVREHLLALRDHFDDLSLANGTLQLEKLQVPATAEELEVLLGPALDLGEALDAAPSQPARQARG